MNSFLLIGYTLLAVAFFNGLLGFLILKKNPHNKNLNKAAAIIGFSAAIYALSAGISYIRADMGLDFDSYYRMCHIGWIALPAFYQVLYYIKDDKSRKAIVVGSLLYFFWLVVIILILTTNWIETGAHSLLPYVDNCGPLERQVRFIGGAMLIFVIYKLFRARRDVTGLKKSQLNYFILGTIIYAAGGSLGAGFFSLFGGLGIDPALVSYFSLPWVALTFYAITHYRLFDIQVIISGTVTIALLTLILGIVNAGLFYLISPYLGSTLAIFISLAVIITTLLKSPLVQIVQGRINNIFIKDRYDYQKILKTSTQAMTSILDQDELLNYLIHTIQKNFGIYKASLFLKNNNEDAYEIRYLWGIDKKNVGDKLETKNIITWFNQTKEIFIKEEQKEILPDDTFDNLYKDLGSVEAELIVPLFFKEKLVGFLTLGKKEDDRPYMQSDIEILETLSSQTAIAIENSSLYTEAITDSLTGLYHHKYFITRFKEEIEHSRLNLTPISLLMIDIDHFKNINDTRGHIVGNKVLIRISQFLKTICRGSDIIARYGGEEFAIVLPHANHKNALIIAERLRNGIEGQRFDDNLKVTVSIGMAYFDKIENVSAEEFIIAADKVLYLAKQNGRNRIEVTTPII